MMNFKKLSLLAAFTMIAAFSFVMPAKAQTRTITGIVTDTADRVLANVSVLVKGTTIGTQTKQDGSFSLHAPARAATLVFTSINYGSLEVPITGDVVNAHLTPVVASLADVVVIGYGTQQRKDVTGAISTVTTKDFQKGTITSPDQLISGKVAGVSVTSNGGAPGSGSVIRIREGASLNASNDPLIIVDGIPLSPNGIAGASNQLALINPNDIESVTVLKDAASTAIYGSRASNGVIIITTKRGRRGKPQINFVTNLSVATVAKEVSVLSAGEIKSFVNNPANRATAAQMALLGTANTNWQKQIYQNAITSDNNLSIAGAVKNLPYRLSLGFLSQQGTLKTDLLQRGTVSLNLTPMLFDNHLKIDINLKGTLSEDHFANQAAIGSAIAFDPTQSVYNGKGAYNEWLQSGGTYNPNATSNPVGLVNQYHSKGNVSRSFGNIQFDYKFHFLPDLHANLNLGYDISEGHGNVLIDSSRQSNGSYSYQGTTSKYKQTTVNTVAEFYLNYVKNIRSIRSNINAVAGYGYYDNKPKTFNYYSFFLNGDSIP
ncbi:MAG: SusC/RagA family TonB-linked outer membrane protein, partial [Bacteroidota bacterium]|nr:SusC/RagA family TonB-linked outer membrane protein [Bacteroidota bacterium]